jgi:Ca-activated chloride channel family protein
VSGGHYYAAPSAGQLDQVYQELGSHLVYGKQFREITVELTIAALVLILLAAGLSAYWFRRLV